MLTNYHQPKGSRPLWDTIPGAYRLQSQRLILNYSFCVVKAAASFKVPWLEIYEQEKEMYQHNLSF